MEGSATASSAAADDEGPESWEVADVDAGMRRLMLSSRKDSDVSCNELEERAEDSGTGFSLNSCSVKSDNLVNTVDQFLRDALQNPRERLSDASNNIGARR